MKKLLLFSIFISTCSLVKLNGQPQPKMTPQQYLEYLNKTINELDNKLPAEVKAEDRATEQAVIEGTSKDLKFLADFSVSLNLDERFSQECKNNLSNCSKKIKEHRETLDELETLIEKRAQYRTVKISMEQIEKIKQKYPEAYALLMQKQKLEMERNNLLQQMNKHSK